MIDLYIAIHDDHRIGIDQSGSRDPGRTYHNSGIDRTFRALEQNGTCGGWDILTRDILDFFKFYPVFIGENCVEIKCSRNHSSSITALPRVLHGFLIDKRSYSKRDVTSG